MFFRVSLGYLKTILKTLRKIRYFYTWHTITEMKKMSSLSVLINHAPALEGATFSILSSRVVFRTISPAVRYRR